jgi:hypothetical protein
MTAIHPTDAARPAPLVAHCDWGSHPRKRWLALALPTPAGYTAFAPQPAGPPETLLARLRERAQGAPVLLGLDLPLGLPLAYAERAGITSFPALLPELGSGRWHAFYQPAATADEIAPARPFYPARPGGTRREHLVHGLELPDASALWRSCDRATATRRAGCPLFWTLGAQQVGKAAISAWRDVLGPALRRGEDVAIWPCDGTLAELLLPGRIVAAEVYPGECYAHLGAIPGRGGKRSQTGRITAGHGLLRWAGRAGVTLEPALQHAIEDGFGARTDGDDPFDTAVGLFGALNVALGLRPPGEPRDERVRRVEGWILGQEHAVTNHEDTKARRHEGAAAC